MPQIDRSSAPSEEPASEVCGGVAQIRAGQFLAVMVVVRMLLFVATSALFGLKMKMKPEIIICVHFDDL